MTQNILLLYIKSLCTPAHWQCPMLGIQLAYLNEPGSIKLWDGVPNPASMKPRSPKLLMRWSLTVLSSVGTFQGLLIYKAHEVYGRNKWQSRFDQVMAGIKGLRSCFRTNDLNKQLQKRNAFDGIIFSVQLKKKIIQNKQKLLISKDKHPSIKT